MSQIGFRNLFFSLVIFVMLLAVSFMLAGTTPASVSNPKLFRYAYGDIPVLAYHKVDDMNIALSLSPEEFEEQIRYLQQNGYHSITSEQLTAYLTAGKDLPENPVMITFDDGYRDNYTNALPILQKYGMTAVVFIITDAIDSDERFLTWEQIKEMQQKGIVFASHTVNHEILTAIPAEQVWTELVDSRRIMEQKLGKAPTVVAYPTGAYNTTVEQMVKRAGYDAAFTIRYGQVGRGSNLYALERIPIFKSADGREKTFQNFYFRFKGALILERLGLIRN